MGKLTGGLTHRYILAIDQGTTNSKALVVDEHGAIAAVSNPVPLTPVHSAPGWIEFDPQEMLAGAHAAVESVLSISRISSGDIIAVGIANQGETVIAFDTQSGEPVYPAISWQDKRNGDLVCQLSGKAELEKIAAITGLFPDPYFSAIKMRWILDNVPDARSLLKQGRLCLGTSDTWLLNRLATNRPIVTDVSTASRTLLCNLQSRTWDDEMCEMLGVPREALPEIVDNTTIVGRYDTRVVGLSAPIAGICVDQQAALFGEGCTRDGESKVTFGTGAFLLTNIGTRNSIRVPGLLTSVGWSIENAGTYVLDGGVYNAGSVMRWLVEDLGLASSFTELDDVVRRTFESGDLDDVFFVPALNGLASPYWDHEATGSWLGLTGRTRIPQLLTSAVESILFRIREIVEASEHAGVDLTTLHADGGPTRSSTFIQSQTDVLGKNIDVFDQTEATAYGVALFAGISVGLWDIEHLPVPVRSSHRFTPNTQRIEIIENRYRRWKKHMSRSLTENQDER